MQSILNSRDISYLKERAREMRIEILKMLEKSGSGHTGGSLSATDIVAALYFYKMFHPFEGPRCTLALYNLGAHRLFRQVASRLTQKGRLPAPGPSLLEDAQWRRDLHRFPWTGFVNC